MSLHSVKMLGISISIDSKKEILEYIKKWLHNETGDKRQETRKSEKPLIIVTPNPEQVVLAQHDRQFADILNKADVAIPDGIGISLAAKFLNAECRMTNDELKLVRIPGIELMEDLVVMAAKEGYRIGLIGGRGGVAVKALECLSRRTSGLKGWAIEPEEKTIEEITRKIVDSHTRLVFVGLGAPKQEYFIERLTMSLRAPAKQSQGDRHALRARDDKRLGVIFMSVGGSFDVISGRIVRAPHAMQALHLEWLWRLVHEPWRIKRQGALIEFMGLVVRDSLFKRAI